MVRMADYMLEYYLANIHPSQCWSMVTVPLPLALLAKPSPLVTVQWMNACMLLSCKLNILLSIVIQMSTLETIINISVIAVVKLLQPSCDKTASLKTTYKTPSWDLWQNIN